MCVCVFVCVVVRLRLQAVVSACVSRHTARTLHSCHSTGALNRVHRSQRFDRFEKKLHAPPRWVDRRAGPHEWVRGIVVDYDTADGFRVVYRTEGLVGFDYVEMLSAHEMDRRLEQQEHLHLVQSELAKQRNMDALELGKHLAKNLDNVLVLLQDKLDAIREQQQRILHSRALEAELSTVKSTYRIGRILHLLEMGSPGGRPDMTQALMLTSPSTDDGVGAAGENAAASVSGRAARLSRKATGGRDADAREDEGRERITRALPGDPRSAGAGSRPRVTFTDNQKQDQSKLQQVLSAVKHSEDEIDSRPSGRQQQGPEATTVFWKLEEERLEAIVARVREQQTALVAGRLTGLSCGCLHPMHPVRIKCAAIVSHQDFQTFINLMIMGSCFAMLFERPDIPTGQQVVLDFTNLGFSIVFIVECILKIVSLGFWIYLRSGWNKIDFLIVLSSFVDIVLTYGVEGGSSDIVKVTKIFRIFRAVRPLGAVLRSGGLTIVLRAVTDSMLPLISTLIISVLVVAVFAIIGMELLQGTMHFCSDRFVLSEANCVGRDMDGNIRVWRNFDRNFDWFASAWITVFSVGTQDDWQVMLMLMSITLVARLKRNMTGRTYYQWPPTRPPLEEACRATAKNGYSPTSSR